MWRGTGIKVWNRDTLERCNIKYVLVTVTTCNLICSMIIESNFRTLSK